MALAAGVTVDEIVGVLIAVAPTVGIAKAVSAAPELGVAIGYDTDSALETMNHGGDG
jgi:4-carboxymuconolactone decarboxylase